jgi:hypothetical protein
MTVDSLEAVARAFYEAQDYARDWSREPELLKEQFRRDAHIAIEVAAKEQVAARCRELRSQFKAAQARLALLRLS